MKKSYIISFLLALPFLLSAQTTNVLKDINESGSSNPGYLRTDGTNLIYQATNGSDGRELVVSQGTTETTNFIDVRPGTYYTYNFASGTKEDLPQETYAQYPCFFNGELYYKGISEYVYFNSTYEYMASYATMTYDFDGQTASVAFDPQIKYSTEYNGTLYFSDKSGKLYSWDGVSSAPEQLLNHDGVFTCYSGFFKRVKNYLIISGALVDDPSTTDVDESSYGNELLAYNLDDNSVKLIGDFTANGNSNFHIDDMAAMRTSYMFFSFGGKLYCFYSGTGELLDLYAGQYAKTDLEDVYVNGDVHVWDDKVYFNGTSNVEGETYVEQLYSFSNMLTYNYLNRLSDIQVEGVNKQHFPKLYAADGTNYLYYTGYNGSDFLLFRTDGISVEAVSGDIEVITDQVPVILNSKVYFVGTDNDAYGEEVYVFDPNGKATAIDELDNNSVNVSVYPNPSNGFVNVEGLSAANATYEIYNLTGQCVETGVINNTVLDYNVSNGMYILKINDGINRVVKKISVQ